jgi:hypothetical protein
MLFPMINIFYFYSGTFGSMAAVSSMAVFCSFLMSCFPLLLLLLFIIVRYIFMQGFYAYIPESIHVSRE